MRDLRSVLRGCFENSSLSVGYREYNLSERKYQYLIVPTNKESIEIPVFALNSLDTKEEAPDAIAIELKYSRNRSYYKSLDASIREAMFHSYRNYYLTPLPISNTVTKQYYATHGAIFDENLLPVAIMTWELEKEYIENTPTEYKYVFTKPLLRVAPEVIINKSNSVERYIINKIMPTVLSLQTILNPATSWRSIIKGDFSKLFRPEILIGALPFEIKTPDIPSISTTSKNLLDIAINNIDDIMQ